MPDLHQLLDPDYLGVLADRPLDEIRAMRADGVTVETGLSYFRRMVQGRLDIVSSEQQRRAEGGEPAQIHDLIGQLPEIFSEQRRPGGTGRMPQNLDVPEVDADLVARLDEIAGPGVLAGLNDLDDAALAALADDLRALERVVSGHRQALFDLIDALQSELTERYRSGEASVDTLLAEG